MLTLNHEMIEEINRWSELGLHVVYDPDAHMGITEEDLADLYNRFDNQGEE